MISILIPAKNEEKNIKECINSAKLELNCRHFDFSYDGKWPKKKNWAIKNIHFKYDWIFILDADERISDELAEELRFCLNNIDIETKGFAIRWEFFFLNKKLKWSWGDQYMPRIFKNKFAQYENLGMTDEGGWDNEVHEHLIINGKIKKLNSKLIHKTRNDLHFWLSKQNDFSSWNAKRRIIKNNAELNNEFFKKKRIVKFIFSKLPFKPLLIFLYIYIIKLGFLDGRVGYHFAVCRAIHEYQNNLKIYEFKKHKKYR